MKVFVYFNLHKKCFSVKALTGENKGRVVAHTHDIELLAPRFKVSEAGRQRVLRERKKNVHAGVVGWYYPDIMTCKFHEDYDTINVRYNPYVYSSFVDANEKPIYNAATARLTVTDKRPKIEASTSGGYK
jgi:hypothetical protein